MSITVELGNDYADIRDQVRRICEGFPGGYWQDLDERSEYPHAFVDALTQSGYLGALIPEEYGGTGLPLRAAAVILETIHAAGCSASACHAQMYIMGTVLRHGSLAQKQQYLPKIASGELRLQAFGVTEPTTGSDTTQLKTRAVKEGDHYVVNGQKIWTSRALQSDLMLLLARTTPVDQVKKRTDGLSVFLIDLRDARGKGCEIRPIATMINHNTTEVFFDNLHIPADTLIGEEGRGFRYILDGMNAVVERRVNVRDTVRNVLADFLAHALGGGVDRCFSHGDLLFNFYRSNSVVACVHFLTTAPDLRGPLRVRALVLVRWPRTGRPRR